MNVPISYFFNFSKDKKTITREEFIESLIKFIYEKNIIKITNKSFFDGRSIKTDYNTLYSDLTTFTSKAFKNMKIDIEKEISDLQNGLKFAVLLHEVKLILFSFIDFLNPRITRFQLRISGE